MKVSYEPVYLNPYKSFKVEKYTHTSKCSSVSWHLHPEYEIVYIQNGQGNLQLGSHSESYSNGLLLFLGPNIPHMPFGNSQFKNNKEIVIQFPESFVIEKLGNFPEFDTIIKFINKSKNGILFSSSTHKKLSSSFLKFDKQNNTEQILNLMSILWQLSIDQNQRFLLKEKLTLDINKYSLERVSKIYQYVNDNYRKEIRSEILAKMLGLTPNSFCRMFKTVTQRSFIDFLNEFRIKKAQELLNSNDILIYEAMSQCGFNDPSYFSKQFKKHTGITPSTYIQQLKKTK